MVKSKEKFSSEPLKKKLKKAKTNDEGDPVDKKENNEFMIDLSSCSTNWKKIEKTIVKSVNGGKKHFLNKKAEKKEDDKKNEIWFDVDHIFIQEQNSKDETENKKEETVSNEIKIESTAKITKAVAIDCEMVGVGDDGRDSILARVSLVNQLNQCIYDKYVMPTEHVTDYRTHVSGIRPEDIKKSNGAEKFEIVQKEVAEIIKDRILVGHAIHNDLKILFLDHPKKKLRDTQRCKLFRKLKPSLGGIPSLKNLAQALLGVTIQIGEHSSVQDAQAAMRIYTMYRKQWEMEMRTRKFKEKNEENNKFDDLVLKQQSLIKSGNDKHKKYIENKLKRRKPLNFKRK